jgi:hypothetical protein
MTVELKVMRQPVKVRCSGVHWRQFDSHAAKESAKGGSRENENGNEATVRLADFGLLVAPKPDEEWTYPTAPHWCSWTKFD